MHSYLVQQRISQAASQNPSNVAVACRDESATYREFERRTNALANFLRDGLVSRGGFVPFFLEKSTNSLEAILAILKSDAAYVPIDVDSPTDRAVSIMMALDATCVIVDSGSKSKIDSILAQLDRPVSVFVIDEFEGGDPTEPEYQNLSIDVAYVLFTSGSTGVPKGVMIPHKAILDYIDWCIEEYGISSSDRVANHAPLYFDNSTFDLYTALFTGAELHLVDGEVNSVITRLISWIEQREISTFFCVPSVLAMLHKTRRLKPELFKKLRHLICAGEVLPPAVLRSWMDLYPHINYSNMYGPTEITVDCTYHRFLEPPAADATAVPIGRCRPNMELFVRLEDDSLSQRPGARGELLVRGTSVAYGYLAQSEKTRQAFVQNPQNPNFADSLYCTGDLVEIEENGDLYFLGRIDDQIKYLGHRIELGEIEAALVALSQVQEGVVVFNNAPETTDQMIGALVAKSDDIAESELRQLLADKLPGYMVPTRIVGTHKEFPRTPNGKYDRKSVARMVFDD